MSTLYELGKQWEEVYEMLLDPEIPEEAVFDTIESIEGVMDIKADSYAKIIKNMDGDMAAIDVEIKRLQERKKAMANGQKRMKDALENMMRSTGRLKFKTALFSFGIQKNGGKLPLIFSEPVPAEWLKPGDPDTEKIRKHLEAGNQLPFAAICERGESLRIR